MSKKMSKTYFKEKQVRSFKLVQLAVQDLNESEALINQMQYESSDQSDFSKVHELIKQAIHSLQYARRDFEKALWASSDTSDTFVEWLKNRNLDELILGEDD